MDAEISATCLRASWPPDVRHVRDARHFVAGALGSWGERQVADAVVLVVSELVTNAVVHACTPFTVTVQRLDDGVLLWVGDGSSELPVESADDVDLAAGSGLKLVAASAADWGAVVHGSGKSVWAVLWEPAAALPVQGPAAQPLARSTASSHRG